VKLLQPLHDLLPDLLLWLLITLPLLMRLWWRLPVTLLLLVIVLTLLRVLPRTLLAMLPLLKRKPRHYLPPLLKNLVAPQQKIPLRPSMVWLRYMLLN